MYLNGSVKQDIISTDLFTTHRYFKTHDFKTSPKKAGINKTNNLLYISVSAAINGNIIIESRDH